MSSASSSRLCCCFRSMWASTVQFIVSQDESVRRRRRLLLGVVVLLLVDVLWVGSSELTDFIFKYEGFDKPFFTTFFKTSSFMIYLTGFLFYEPWRLQCITCLKNETSSNVLVSAVNQDSEHTSLLNSPSSSGETTPIPRQLMNEPTFEEMTDEDISASRSAEVASSSFEIIPRPRRVTFSSVREVRQLSDHNSEQARLTRLPYHLGEDQKLPFHRVATVALLFCLLWFCANCSYQEAIVHTSPAAGKYFAILIRGFLESNGAQQHPEERLQPTEQEEVVGQESSGIVLRERMQGQANGGEDNLDPVFYVPPYTPNQLMELEVPLQSLLQSVHSSPVREQVTEGYLPVTVSSANQLSYRQEQTGASVLANGAWYPPEAANNVGRLPVEHPDMAEFPLHQHEILNRPASPKLMAALLAQFCCGKLTLKVENFSKLLQNARDVVGWSYESLPFSTDPFGYQFSLIIFPLGVNGGDREHISLFVRTKRGKFDNILPWPFMGSFSFTILDQSDVADGFHNHITGTFAAKGNQRAFQKPVAGENGTLYGFAKMAPIEMVCTQRYSREDSVMIKVEVDKIP